MEEAHVPSILLDPLTNRLTFLDLALGWIPFYLGSLSLKTSFPKLESLILRRTGFSHGASSFLWEHMEPLVMFQNARRLQRVAMHYPVFEASFGKVLFPWKQLTHLIISKRIFYDVLEDLLRSCVNLQQGVFNLTDDPYPVSSCEVKTVLHHLVDLTIMMDATLNPSILRNFELPALQSLRLGPLIISDEHWGERNLLYPHLSSISRLSLQANHMRNETLTCGRIVELLRFALNVERLDLCPGIFYPDLMELLTVDTSGWTVTAASPTPILPKLRSLSVDLGVRPSGIQAYLELLDTLTERFSALALGKMVKSRWYSEVGMARLEELYIFLAKEDGAIINQIRDVLEECLDEGFVVEDRSADISGHWSTRLKDEEISWSEGLSVLVSELKINA